MQEEPSTPSIEPAPAAQESLVPSEPAAATQVSDVAAPDAVEALDKPVLPEAAATPAAAESPQTPGLSPAACATRLAELFPALFTVPGAPGPARPIKLRIHADIQARAPGLFSKRVLGLFFSRYTTSNAYLKALASSPHRFDLDGQPAGEIAEEHRQAASEELARRHAMAAERRAMEGPPRRGNPAPSGTEPPPGARPNAPRAKGGPAPHHSQRRDTPQHAQRAAARGMRHEDRVDARPARYLDKPPAARPARAARGAAAVRAQRTESPPPLTARPVPGGRPADPAQREHMLLARSFESSPLSKANFCALKGITEAALDAAMAQVNAERGPQGAAPNAARRSSRR